MNTRQYLWHELKKAQQNLEEVYDPSPDALLLGTQRAIAQMLNVVSLITEPTLGEWLGGNNRGES